jgi:ParB family transcriptional regulator, chromosome partitioning protein
VKSYLSENKISAGHARALLGQPDPEALARAVVDQGLNVRQLEALTQERARKAGKAPKARPRANKKDPDTLALEKRLSDVLGLTVTVMPRGEGGELRIRYRSLDQLDEVIARLQRSA